MMMRMIRYERFALGIEHRVGQAGMNIEKIIFNSIPVYL